MSHDHTAGARSGKRTGSRLFIVLSSVGGGRIKLITKLTLRQKKTGIFLTRGNRNMEVAMLLPVIIVSDKIIKNINLTN